jgi:glutathione synthase/RimK-type ligase-like ATP-grasp enzyme
VPLKLRLVSKKLGSNSLAALAAGLSTKLGYKVFRSKAPHSFRSNLVYGDCKNKTSQYEWFKAQGISALDFTTSHEEAKAWVKDGQVVFARLLTRSSEGKGIVVCETEEQVPVAPVYTKYKKKKKEFRVHIFQQEVVHVLEKRKRKEFEGTVNTKVRNTANGYVFCSQDVVEPEGIRELARKASKVTNSDFKGVDIGFNEKLNELFVIEVNSCPGIQGSNIDKYISAIIGN